MAAVRGPRAPSIKAFTEPMRSQSSPKTRCAGQGLTACRGLQADALVTRNFSLSRAWSCWRAMKQGRRSKSCTPVNPMRHKFGRARSIASAMASTEGLWITLLTSSMAVSSRDTVSFLACRAGAGRLPGRVCLPVIPARFNAAELAQPACKDLAVR